MANKHVIQSGLFKHRPPGKEKSLDDGVIEKPGPRHRLGSFADLVADGAAPILVQTPNGTSRQNHKESDNVDLRMGGRWGKNAGKWDGDMSGN